MQTINVAIELDPVNDGAVITSVGLKRKDEGALIIATNGKSVSLMWRRLRTSWTG